MHKSNWHGPVVCNDDKTTKPEPRHSDYSYKYYRAKQLHLMPNLRMTGAIPLLLNAFVACIRKSYMLPLTFTWLSCIYLFHFKNCCNEGPNSSYDALSSDPPHALTKPLDTHHAISITARTPRTSLHPSRIYQRQWARALKQVFKSLDADETWRHSRTSNPWPSPLI
jgi:hypothetical protein